MYVGLFSLLVEPSCGSTLGKEARIREIGARSIYRRGIRSIDR